MWLVYLATCCSSRQMAYNNVVLNPAYALEFLFLNVCFVLLFTHISSLSAAPYSFCSLFLYNCLACEHRNNMTHDDSNLGRYNLRIPFTQSDLFPIIHLSRTAGGGISVGEALFNHSRSAKRKKIAIE